MDPLRDLLMVKQPGRWSLRAVPQDHFDSRVPYRRLANFGSGVVLLLGHPLDGDVLLANIRAHGGAQAPAAGLLDHQQVAQRVHVVYTP